MLKRSKMIALLATAGSLIGWGGCGGFGDFGGGLLARGFVDNWWIDVVTDWLAEDLFIG